MDGEPQFRRDLYRGTAPFYDRYRLPYPDELFADLLARTSGSPRRRMLDLACGTGQVTIPLAAAFDQVWAVDLEPETVAFASAKAKRLGVGNIRWIEGRAEDVSAGETFDLVTVGTAFHRLARPVVASLTAGWLRDGGHLALLWNRTPMDGDAAWQRALVACTERWMHELVAVDRLPEGLQDHFAEQPHLSVVAAAGLSVIESFEFSVPHDWTVPELVGLLQSTSILPPAVVADRADELTADLERALLAAEPSGVFTELSTFAYDLAAMSPAPIDGLNA